MNQNKALGFLYHNAFGRIILKPLTFSPVSKLAGKYMDSSLSKHRIKKFIKENSIDMSEYADCEYNSFNSFFTRKIKREARVISKEGFACPCDSRLSAFEITDDLCFFIKGAPYSVKTLLDGDSVADEFSGGSVLVFRLCVDDYHRYSFFDSGRVVKQPRHIKGVFHTVNPISLGKYNFFHQNSREYTVIETNNFGKAVYCEIGALLVGRIVNHTVDTFNVGDEKGFFEFGGSTVVVLLSKQYRIGGKYYENTRNGVETVVKLGQRLD